MTISIANINAQWRGEKPKAAPAAKSIDKLSKPELIALAKSKGMAATGTKADLIARIGGK